MILRATIATALALVAGCSLASEPPAVAVARLPDRLLRCTLARATNFDGTREQQLDELKLVGSHQFDLALPSVPVRTTPPPEAYEAPEPVAPGTRIVADPDHIGRLAIRFNRVIDLWPERVELSTEVSSTLFQLIIVTPIDAAAGTARILLAQADASLTYNPDEVYIGPCNILNGKGSSINQR